MEDRPPGSIQSTHLHSAACESFHKCNKLNFKWSIWENLIPVPHKFPKRVDAEQKTCGEGADYCGHQGEAGCSERVLYKEALTS